MCAYTEVFVLACVCWLMLLWEGVCFLLFVGYLQQFFLLPSGHE